MFPLRWDFISATLLVLPQVNLGDTRSVHIFLGSLPTLTENKDKSTTVLVCLRLGKENRPIKFASKTFQIPSGKGLFPKLFIFRETALGSILLVY